MTPLPDDLSEEEKRGFDPRGKAYGVIYRAMCRINGKIYIGLTTKSLFTRITSHKKHAKERSNHFQLAINKYGIEAFDFEIIDTGYSQAELNDMERYWVEYYDTINSGYNSVVPTRVDYSASRERQLSHKVPEHLLEQFLENGKKTRFAKGYKQKEEWKQAKSEAYKGKHHSVATEFPSVRIQCVQTGTIYETMNAAAREFGISHTNWSRYFAGESKSVKGYQWIKLTN